jgi:hypothetical protein
MRRQRPVSITNQPDLTYLRVGDQTAGTLRFALVGIASDSDINDPLRVNKFVAEALAAVASVLDGFGPDQH